MNGIILNFYQIITILCNILKVRDFLSDLRLDIMSFPYILGCILYKIKNHIQNEGCFSDLGLDILSFPYILGCIL